MQERGPRFEEQYKAKPKYDPLRWLAACLGHPAGAGFMYGNFFALKITKVLPACVRQKMNVLNAYDS
jgi:hypothetical protein